MRKIAVIGVGKMGGGIARNLSKAGLEVNVFDFSQDAMAACVELGATAVESALAAVEGADLVITSLPMPVHVIAMYNELAPALPEGTVCMDVSTIDPATARKLYEDLQGRGLKFVACLLGKGPAQAEAGELPLFVGGDDDVLDSVTPIFDIIGDQVYRLGTVDAAAMFKLVSNLIGMTNLAVLAEGYLLCHRAGVNDEDFTRALADTGGWSYQAQLRLPWMMAGDFAPRFPMTLGLKDVRLAVDIAGQYGLAVPVAAAGMSQLASAVAHGFANEDVNAMLKVLDPQGEVFGA